MIIVSTVIFLAPCVYANTLPPGPTGSAPTDKPLFLTFERSGPGDARSYVVDRKGFYERDGWSRSDRGRIGAFNDDEGSRNKGFSSNFSVNGFNSRSSSGGTGWSLSGGAGFSGGIGKGADGSLPGGSGFFAMKGLGDGAGFGGGKSLGSTLSDSGSGGSVSLGPEGGGKGLADPTSVSATPLPASWSMMLIGLAFGLLVWLRKSKFSPTRKGERPAVA